MKPVIIVIPTLALLADCGSDGAAGPSGRDMRGTWTYDASQISAGGPNYCVVSGTRVTITNQSGNVFSGTYNTGFIACTGPGLHDTVPVGSGTVVSGVVSGDSVRFNFDNSNWRNVGLAGTTSMTGVVNVQLTIGGSSAVAAGAWTATKQ